MRLAELINQIEDTDAINYSRFSYFGVNNSQTLAMEFYLRGHTDLDVIVQCDKELGASYYYHLVQSPSKKRPRKHSICILDNKNLLVFISDYTTSREKIELKERYDILYTRESKHMGN